MFFILSTILEVCNIYENFNALLFSLLNLFYLKIGVDFSSMFPVMLQLRTIVINNTLDLFMNVEATYVR